MDQAKKMELLADVFDMDVESLKPELKLLDIEEWNSMTKLSLIVMMSDELGKQLVNADIKKFETVQDILNFMD